ncbi:MAG: hypothetical protein FWC96_08160 [Oscillospiraceae bacterium]|nr:hypothetical protein [Oscillospiraceae bacterium]
MRKTVLIFILLVAFLLTGCNVTTSSTPSEPSEYFLVLEHLIEAYKAFWPYENIVPVVPWEGWYIEDWEDFFRVDFSFDSFPEKITYATEFETYHIDVDTITAYLSVEGDYYMGKGMDFRLAIKAGDRWLHFMLYEIIFDIIRITSPESYWVDTIVNDYYDYVPGSGIQPYNRSGRHTNRQLIPGTYRIFRSVSIWCGEYGREGVARSSEWRGYVWTEFVVYE